MFRSLQFWTALLIFASQTRCDKLLEVKDPWLDALNRNVSQTCSNAISTLDRRFSLAASLPKERETYENCFGKGLSTELVTDDRFLYSMLQCFKIAGETLYSKSEYTLHYCYGYNSEEYESPAYSICVPSPCASDNLTLLDNWKSITTQGADQIPITQTKCVRSRSEKQWYQKALPVLSLLYIMFSLLIVSMATVYHYQRTDKTHTFSSELFLAFSAKTNLLKICKPVANQRSMITCMYGMRALTIVWIVIGHSFAWIEPYIENVEEYKSDIANNLHSQWISNFLLTVDTFFVLGGVVNAYGWFSKIEKMEVKPDWTSIDYWLKFYRHRVVRLWPACFYTLLGVMFLSNAHFHAMWPELDPAVQCPKYWWQNLLFIGSLFGNPCMQWTWYISTEFLMYLVSPIFLLSLHQSKLFGISLSVSMIILSSLLRAYAMLAYNMPPTQLGWSKPPIFNANFMQHFSAMYIQPQYRIGPYIIGLLLGYYLWSIKGSPPRNARKWVTAGWSISTLLGLSAVYGLYPISRGWNWPVYYVIYGSIHRVMFALSIAWVIYACHTGIGGFVNRLLSLNIFYPFASLSYSVYLSHMPVLYGSFLQLPFPYHYSGQLPMLLHCILRYILSHIIGLQCSLLSEYPAVNIEGILLSKSSNMRGAHGIKQLSKTANGSVTEHPEGQTEKLSLRQLNEHVNLNQADAEDR